MTALLVQHRQLVWGGGGGGGGGEKKVYQKSQNEGGQVQFQRCIYEQAQMEKEKLLVSPSWLHYRATGHTVMNVMIKPGHRKMCYIFLVTDTFSNWIPKLKLLGLLLYKWKEFWPAREPCIGPTQGRVGQIGLRERREAVIKLEKQLQQQQTMKYKLLYEYNCCWNVIQ